MLFLVSKLGIKLQDLHCKPENDYRNFSFPNCLHSKLIMQQLTELIFYLIKTTSRPNRTADSEKHHNTHFYLFVLKVKCFTSKYQSILGYFS